MAFYRRLVRVWTSDVQRRSFCRSWNEANSWVWLLMVLTEDRPELHQEMQHLYLHQLHGPWILVDRTGKTILHNIKWSQKWIWMRILQFHCSNAGFDVFEIALSVGSHWPSESVHSSESCFAGSARMGAICLAIPGLCSGVTLESLDLPICRFSMSGGGFLPNGWEWGCTEKSFSKIGKSFSRSSKWINKGLKVWFRWCLLLFVHKIVIRI